MLFSDIWAKGGVGNFPRAQFHVPFPQGRGENTDASQRPLLGCFLSRPPHVSRFSCYGRRQRQGLRRGCM